MADPLVHIVDYGLGNLGSIVNMYRRIGTPVLLTSDAAEISKAKRILIPGVGAFDTGMINIRERGLLDVLNEKALVEKVPTLGICLGMQLLTESSDEGRETGLRWINGRTVEMKKFIQPGEDIKLPHIGWNYVDAANDHFLIRRLPEEPRFYFVHSYMVTCDDPREVVTTTPYGTIDFVSMCQKGNIFGAQFHPEKSHKFGMQLLKNFAEWEA